MENDKKIQKNYDELKKKSDKTEKFLRLANELNIDDKDVPRTEKGLQTKAKELMERLNKKLEKEEVEEVKKEKKVKKEKNNKKY
jgi:hypothetical protein